VSRHILHGMLYRWWFRRALPVVNKVLCISTETMALLENVYGAPKNMLELYPLGGFVLSRSDREDRRRTTRQQHGWEVANFIFLQSGKMTNRKKLIESLIAFKNIPGDHLRFVIVGLLTDEVRGKVESLISSDPRILFLGWKSSEELTGLLCAADVYVQPGTQSATMQHALCCGCPVIIDDVPAHRVYADADVTLIGTEKALEVAMANALTWDGEGKSKKASTFARERLDYKVLANRILTR
jgi:1,2-diacylglycerol 3-alpha-glucosyltransferase